MVSKPSVNVDILAENAGTITAFGETHAVKNLDGVAWRTLHTVNPESAEYTLAVYDILERHIPTLGARVWDLQAGQAGRVLAVAMKIVTDVEDSFPNESGAPSEIPTSSTSQVSP